MVEFEVIVVEFLPDELERRARLERDRKRKWTQNNRPWLANRARRRYRRSNYRTCPGTPEDPVCVIELTSTRCVRCDYHAHKWAKALRRAAYHAGRNQPMRSRVCRLAGCDNPVSARKRYCSYECRAEAQRQSERRYEDMHREERNQARREARAQDGPRNVERDNEDMIDYCAPGAASRAPSFSGAPEKPALRRVRQEDGLPDGRVLSPALRAQQLDLSRVPGAVRRDRVRAARLAQDLARAEQGATGVVSWDSSLQDLQQAVANGARVVDVSNSAIDGSVLRRRPQYAISDPASAGTLYPGRPDDYSQALLGRGVRRAAPPKNSGPRTPTIINWPANPSSVSSWTTSSARSA